MVALFPLLGINLIFWAIVGIARFIVEKISSIKIMEYVCRVHQFLDNDPTIKHLASIFAGALAGIISFFLLLLWLSFVLNTIITFSTTNIFFVEAAIAMWIFSGFLGGYIAGYIQNQFNIKTIAIVSSLYMIFFLYKFFQNTNQVLLVEVEDFLAFGFLFITVSVSVAIGNYFGSFFSKRKERSVHYTRKEKPESPHKVEPQDVAVLIPARNEESSIAATIRSLREIISPQNIFVGSDGSTDKTVEIARSFGVRVVDINPNLGKAKTLTYLLYNFNICDHYKAILIIDADSEINKNYLRHALPLFDNPKVVAVAGHAFARWKPHRFPKWSMFFTAYRTRLYRVLQATVRYGQTWEYTNATAIVPGFASMYRTSILPHINITADNLCIEDFNMTFEIHHNRLGKIGYTPKAFAHSQDPDNLVDYVKQVKRWSLGFWQTVLRHGFWPSFFSLVLAVFILEMLLYGLVFLMIPATIIWFITHLFQPILIPVIKLPTIAEVSFTDMVIGVFLIDYLITVIVAFIERKPLLFIYGLGFIFLRYIDIVVGLLTLPLAFITKSNGTWVSPRRV